MQRIHINTIPNKIGTVITIAGFVQTIRDRGSIKFLLIRDITGIVQAIITKHQAETFAIAQKLSLESVIKLTGLVKEAKNTDLGVEIEAQEITILSLAEPELPIHVINKSEQGETDPSLCMDWRWIDLRKAKNTLIFKTWTTFESACRDYWCENNYIEIHSPKLISTASESGSEVFEVKYFDRKAYLAQSPQFYKQMAMAAGFEKVFEVGPVFRAESSFTTRHATEFTGYDIELSYIDSHEEVMCEEENMIHHAIKKIKELHGEEIKKLFDREIIVPTIPFPRLTLKEVKEILASQNIKVDPEGDLSPEEEREISKHIQQALNHEFLFVTEYPASVRAFYHMRMEQNKNLTKSFDLLWNGIEITTGAQREHRYDILRKQAIEKNMNLNSLSFYLNFFKYGCPPHGGFGMGPNRFIMKLLNLESIREAMFVYRGVKRLEP